MHIATHANSKTKIPAAAQAESAQQAPAQSLSRQQIMSATATILRESGYDATTIRRIARELDCAVGSIYRYFKDKRDLLFEVAQAAIEPATLVIEQGGSVIASAKLYHQLAHGDAALYQLAFWLASVDGNESESLEGEDDATQALQTLANSETAEALSPAKDRRRKPRLPLGKAVPPVIKRLINGWGKRLGDANLASSCWMTLHGCTTLGIDERQTMGAIKSMLPQPGGKRKPATKKHSVQTTAKESDKAGRSKQPKQTAHIEEPVEDVCLL
jgi:AcrR family transcriptional regulator